MNLKPFSGSGSTPSRRRFWDVLQTAVTASQKVAGRNVTVDEHPGKGSVINIADTSNRRRRDGGGGGGPTTGACCYADGTCDVLTEAECTDAGGNYQGNGTLCDEMTPCTGACCFDTDCFENMTEADCEGSSGIFQGFGSTCDPNPCVDCSGGPCGFENPLDGLLYLRKIYTHSVDNTMCPATGYCQPEYPEGCAEPGCHSIWNGCNQVFVVKTRHYTLSSEEHSSLPDCSVSTIEEEVPVEAVCSHAVNIEGTGCDLTCGEPIGGTNLCYSFDPDIDPPFYSDCGIITTTITYADLSPCQ